MSKTGILVIGGRLASLYDDCLKMRIYTDKKKFQEVRLIVRSIDEALEKLTQMGITRLYVSEASGKDIRLSKTRGLELIEEENLWKDKLYKNFVMSAYCYN